MGAESPSNKYKKLPPAEPLEKYGPWQEGAEEIEKFLLIDPSPLRLDEESTIEALTESNNFDNNVFKPAPKMLEELESGEFEVSMVARSTGDRNRIDKMLTQFEEKGAWKPAKLEHLLAFCKQYPQYVTEHPLIALGSVHPTQRQAPKVMRTSDDALVLGTHYLNAGFNDDIDFLIVRRKPSEYEASEQ